MSVPPSGAVRNHGSRQHAGITRAPPPVGAAGPPPSRAAFRSRVTSASQAALRSSWCSVVRPARVSSRAAGLSVFRYHSMVWPPPGINTLITRRAVYADGRYISAAGIFRYSGNPGSDRPNGPNKSLRGRPGRAPANSGPVGAHRHAARPIAEAAARVNSRSSGRGSGAAQLALAEGRPGSPGPGPRPAVTAMVPVMKADSPRADSRDADSPGPDALAAGDRDLLPLLPEHSSASPDGELAVGGVGVRELADRFGTRPTSWTRRGCASRPSGCAPDWPRGIPIARSYSRPSHSPARLRTGCSTTRAWASMSPGPVNSSWRGPPESRRSGCTCTATPRPRPRSGWPPRPGSPPWWWTTSTTSTGWRAWSPGSRES